MKKIIFCASALLMFACSQPKRSLKAITEDMGALMEKAEQSESADQFESKFAELKNEFKDKLTEVNKDSISKLMGGMQIHDTTYNQIIKSFNERFASTTLKSVIDKEREEKEAKKQIMRNLQAMQDSLETEIKKADEILKAK